MKYTKSDKANLYFLDEQISYQTGIEGHQVRKTVYGLTPDGLLTLKKNFCWNGSSFVQDTLECMRASAFHDAMCRMIAEGLLPSSLRGKADKIYYAICEEDKMPRHRARLRLIGLRAYKVLTNIFRVG